ncbi:MAG TPA: hypothetical protein VK039_03110, partial [Brevibacterium sp.]|nr:hypothetical protein [Brevibacterium sp.]
QKDGRVLLALRRFFQQARPRLGLTAVVLVGRFPEAQILRRWPWAPAFERTIDGGPKVPRRRGGAGRRFRRHRPRGPQRQLGGRLPAAGRHPCAPPAAHGGGHHRRLLAAREP